MSRRVRGSQYQTCFCVLPSPRDIEVPPAVPAVMAKQGQWDLGSLIREGQQDVPIPAGQICIHGLVLPLPNCRMETSSQAPNQMAGAQEPCHNFATLSTICLFSLQG